MQKIEVLPQPSNRGLVAFSRDDARYGDALSEVAPGLAYRPVASCMGTKGRPKSPDDFMAAEKPGK